MRADVKMFQPGYLFITLIFSLLLHTAITRAAVPEVMTPPVPELIIHNARITTQNPGQPEASALAIRDGVFQAVGDDKAILALAGDSTLKVDAKQRRVLPGLNDSHLHVVRGGRFYNLELRWEGVPSLQQGLDMISEQAKRTPKGQWVRVVGGWSPYQFEEQRFPTIEELNAAAPDHPVFVLFLYSRGFLNRAGMDELGITAATEAPPGSYYEKDAAGRLTGVLVADPSPVILYQTIAKLPQLSAEDQVNSSRQFYRELNRLGLTSAIDAGGGGHGFPLDYAGSAELAATGDLPLRVSNYLFPQLPGRELQEFRDWMTITVPGENTHTGLEHGFEIEGGGEFLVWSAGDYENFMSAQPVQGKEMEEGLTAVATLLVKQRWPFRIHATYNESISRILNVLEEINREIPFDGLRWAIDHAETVTPKNIQRIKALGGGVAIQSRLAFAGEYFQQRYGKVAAEDAPPLRALLDSGVPLGAGSDATRVSNYNPWTALQWMVTGESIGGTQLLNQANRLTREEALRLYTLGSAWFSGEETRKGRIAPGQFADLAVLSEDYFEIPADRIDTIESLLTVVGGRTVYAVGEYQSLAPAPPPVAPTWSPVTRFGGHWRAP